MDEDVKTYGIHGSTSMQPSELIYGGSDRGDIRTALREGKHSREEEERGREVYRIHSKWKNLKGGYEFEMEKGFGIEG